MVGITFEKWLPTEDSETLKFYADCKVLLKTSKSLVSGLKNILAKTVENSKEKDLENAVENMASVIEGMTRIGMYKLTESLSEIENHRKHAWKLRLWIERLAISRLTADIINQSLDTALIGSVLRMAHLYNESLKLTVTGDIRGVNICSNTCPMLLYPLRRFSITRILQLLANKRSEYSCYLLVDGLLTKYFSPKDTETAVKNEVPPETVEEVKEEALPDEKTEDEKITQMLVAQDSASSDTSVEIYKALTKHLQQPQDIEENNGTSLQVLLRLEEKRVGTLLAVAGRVSPQLLGPSCLKPSKTTGQPKVKKPVKTKLSEHYLEVLWGEVGGCLEHGLLWWNPDPLGVSPPSHVQHLREFLTELKHTDFIPPSLVPAAESLADALGCHVAATSWDQLFKNTLVAAANQHGRIITLPGMQGTATGQLFVDMLGDLVQLNNACEDIFLTIETLPLVEQIPVLHRLDHSVHTARLWASSQCRQLASNWQVDAFYNVAYTDINKMLGELNKLKLADHGEIPQTTSVPVTVCAKMRAKLVSEVRTNIEKLKQTPNECINVLASACRTICLANLHMCFPVPMYWKQSGPLPDCASDYVEGYLDCIFRPVLSATSKMSFDIKQRSTGMILRILCESWLEYIYLHRIKFSEWGAVQLLTDFGAVPTWLMERVSLPKEILNSLVAHEVLRRCEGVGRLLLRRPGESIAMSQFGHRSTSNDEGSADNMPAEMYVPNQEQWLELRAPARANICCQL